MSNKYLSKTQINHLEYIIFTGDRTLWFSKWSHSYLWVISPDRMLGQGGTVTSRERLLCWQIFLSSSLWLPGPTLKELVWWSRLVFGPGTLWQDSTTMSLGSLGHLTGKIDWLGIFLQFRKPRVIDMDQTPAFSFSIWNGNTLCSSASSRFFRIEGVSLSLLLFISEHKWRHVVMGVWEGIAGCCWRIRKVDLTVSVVLALLCSLWCFLLCSGQFLGSTCFLWLCQAPAF